jgi:hypothetical protein
MLDWVIIGGGIHGTHLAFALTQHGASKDRLRVLDPQPHLLARWHHVTANTGMGYLRSPMVHSLHTDPRALGVFARIYDKAEYTRFIPTFNRPSLELFNRHSQYLIDKYQIDTLHVQSAAQRLEQITDGWRIHTHQGTLETQRVVLAVGMDNELFNIPAWADVLRSDGHGVHHLFEPSFHLDDVQPSERVAIVGGGISAAQAAIALAERGNPVTLVSRHGPRIYDFDSDPCWQNVSCLRSFHQLQDYNQRRSVINTARHRGSMPADVAIGLDEMIASERVIYLQAEVQSATVVNHKLSIQVSERGELVLDRILLATGWQRKRPGGALVDQLIQDYELPTADDGFPVVTETLCWHLTGLHVTGGLAELEIGPTARNVIGARLASQRLVHLI